MMKNHWIVDSHCDSIITYAGGKYCLNKPYPGGQWDLQRAKQGKIGLQFFACYIEEAYKPERSVSRGLELIEAFHRFVDENSGQVFHILQREDIQKLPDSEKIALLLSIEGGEILGEKIFMLDICYRLGVRALGLTWNQRNAIADGAGEETSSRLTRFGTQVVQRMNDLGMLIDVSHLNEAGFWHVMEISEKPIIASHSCAKKICSHPRNLTDPQLRELARKKGVVGINFAPDFLTEKGRAELKDVLRHIQHIAEVAGVDVIGFGSDFDGINEVPAGLENVGCYPMLVEALDKAGFNPNELAQMAHGNIRRLLLDVLK